MQFKLHFNQAVIARLTSDCVSNTYILCIVTSLDHNKTPWTFSISENSNLIHIYETEYL